MASAGQPALQEPALSGIKVVEIAGGTAAAYCGRLFADNGASVTLVRATNSPDTDHGVRADTETEKLYGEWLSAGKAVSMAASDSAETAALCRDADIVLIGEDAVFDAAKAAPKIATVALSWFGDQGVYRNWRGNDLVIQALTGMPQITGPIEGPPIHAGDRQSSLIGGVMAYIGAVSAIVGGTRVRPPRLDVNILESNISVAEMTMHFTERGDDVRRAGINRFLPNGPVGVYPCKEGWIGLIASTPDQWRTLCAALDLKDFAADQGLATKELRHARLGEVEPEIIRVLSSRTAEQWAEMGRAIKLPIVVMPNAEGILSHPIFAERASLATFAKGGREYRVPRTPFALTRTPTKTRIDAPSPEGRPWTDIQRASAAGTRLLDGITVVDFTMGWAGPLASRLLGDLGADILKIEAGRYPDWWRGTNWTAEFIAKKGYENAKIYCAMNRGKRGVSLDLTQPAGREAALALVAKADAVLENQAAGVMEKLGLGYKDVTAVNPDIVMMSMSAFGAGTSWSETRAYGSTLEQGAGLPSFMGLPGGIPTMAHLAHGDPIGGLYGCAAILTALAVKKRTGAGQFVNLSMIETINQFTVPALLHYQVTGQEPPRRGNRHAVFAPHNIYRARGDDEWIAVSADSDEAFKALAQAIGRDAWASDVRFATREGRQTHADELDSGIEAWSKEREAEAAARDLQERGVSAARVLNVADLFTNEHLDQAGFFVEHVREYSGPQRQAGVAIRHNGKRIGSGLAAPLLGEHSWDVLSTIGGVSREHYDALVAGGIIAFEPRAIRSKPADTGGLADPGVTKQHVVICEAGMRKNLRL